MDALRVCPAQQDIEDRHTVSLCASSAIDPRLAPDHFDMIGGDIAERKTQCEGTGQVTFFPKIPIVSDLTVS